MRAFLIALVVVAVAALALYSLAPYISKPLAPTTSPQTSTSSPQTAASTTSNVATNVQTRPSEAGASSQQSSTSTTTAAGVNTATQTAMSSPSPSLLPRPNITVELATTEVNTTRLPTNSTLVFLVVNKGGAKGVVYINGTEVVLGPGEEAQVNFTTTIRRAGLNQVLLYINGTPSQYWLRAYYFTPLLVAEPITIQTYKLPIEVVVNVTIENVGNYTGSVGGVEIPPGGNATVAVSLNVTAAGRYEVEAYGVPVEVYVEYLATGYSVYIWSPPVEAVPGEAVPVAFYVRNTGNATEALVANGTVLRLAPGEGAWLNYTVPAYSRRPVALVVNGTTWRWILNVSVIALKALLEIGGGIYNPAITPQIVVESSTAAVPYVWLISTNATHRTVVVIVGGAAYTIPPSGVAQINGTLQARLNAWNTVSVQINGTTYSMQVYVQLKPPTLYVAGITGMSFTDTRTYIQQASCSGTPIGTVTFTATVYSMSGTVSYSGSTITFSGSITVYIDKLGKTITASYSGSSTNGAGQVTAQIGSYTIVVKFSGSSVTSVTVNGEIVTCAASIIPIPAFMYQEPPTGTIDAVSFATQIANLFAKGGSEYITNAYYDGQRVVLVDGEGYTMTYSGNAISGPLQVTIYGQISQVS